MRETTAKPDTAAAARTADASHSSARLRGLAVHRHPRGGNEVEREQRRQHVDLVRTKERGRDQRNRGHAQHRHDVYVAREPVARRALREQHRGESREDRDGGGD
jgi:hypothetical protein